MQSLPRLQGTCVTDMCREHPLLQGEIYTAMKYIAVGQNLLQALANMMMSLVKRMSAIVDSEYAC